MLTLSVLGPVVLRQDGVERRVPGGKTTELLVRLALEAGTRIRTEQLLEDLWPSPDHGASPNTLQVKVSRLRRALGDPGIVRGDSTGYTLGIDPADVDATQVLRLVDDASILRERGHHTAAARACEAALGLYSGSVLPDAGESPWVTPYRARLESSRLSLLEHRLASLIALGADTAVVAELETLVEAHPLREDLWALLVTALYRAGRQADALAASARVRRRLADDLGVDPGPALQHLEQQVLQHDPALVLPRQRAHAPASGGPGNLPGDLPSLVGRDDDLERVVAALTRHGLVTLTGTAGTGKTRLALEAAGRTPPAGGAWWVRLDSAHDQQTVWQTVGEALGLVDPTRRAVTERVATGHLLLLLDGCEHVAPETAEVVGPLLAAGDGVRLLATSQVPLKVAGEHVLGLEPLGAADAVALFTARAASQRPDALDDDDAPRLVEDVCRSLDGLPLAIELAAARTKVLPLREIARRLDDRFALLRDPTSSLPARRTTLRAALAWSHDLLFPDDQRGLWALSVFTAGAPLPAVEAVLGALEVPAENAIDIVSRLVDRSLASAEVPRRGHPRYRLLDSVRDLGRERLHQADLFDVAAAAHAAWFTAAADRAALGGRGPEQPDHVALARAERANIDAALSWCATNDPTQGVRAAVGFGWTWVVMGTGVVGATRINQALAAASSTSKSERAAALTLCGWFEASGGDLDRAATAIEEAIRIGDPTAAAVGRLHLAFVRTQGGRAADALTLLDGCRPDLHRFGLRWEEAVSWLLAAWAHISAGEVAAGAAACERAVGQLEPIGDRWAIAHAEGLLGELAQAEHRYADATDHLGHAARATGELGFVAAHAHHLLNLGRAQHQAGDTAAGIATLQQSVDLGVQCGDTRTAAFARTRLAQMMRALGRLGPATELAEQAHEWFLAAGGGDGARLAAHLVAALHADAAGTSARDELVDVLTQARDTGDALVEILTLDALAAVDAHAGDHVRGQAELEAADGLFAERTGLWAGDRLDDDVARRMLPAAR